MKYSIKFTSKFKTAFKKLDQKAKDEVLEILERLAEDVTLEPKFKDHQLSGNLANFRDCHVRPNLVLIYEKNENFLLLTAIAIGNHGVVF